MTERKFTQISLKTVELSLYQVLIEFLPEKLVHFWIFFQFLFPRRPLEVLDPINDVLEVVEGEDSRASEENELGNEIHFHVDFRC